MAKNSSLPFGGRPNSPTTNDRRRTSCFYGPNLGHDSR
jgi:hypothetical protein